MTDVIDRAGQTDGFATAVDMRSGPVVRRPRATTTGGVLRAFVAALLIGASAIHFGMMGEHAGVSWTHGLFFALVAWAQLGLAILVVIRPQRTTALAVIAVNLGVLGVWIVSRTVGIAIGGDGTPEAWGWVDGLCAAFEAAAILLTLPLLGRSFSRRPLSRGVGYGAAAFVGVMVIALTAWIFSPSFASGGGASADGHNHSHGTGAVAADGHAHSHAPVDDKGLSLLSNGHHHAFGPEKPLDAASRAQLTAQMNTTIDVAKQYPTVAAAEAGGYHRTGPYMPGIGAHYIAFNAPGALNPSGAMDDAALHHPLALIFDGTNPDSKIAGFMYYSMSKTAPTGFAGPNDNWHYHENLCLKFSPGGVIDVPFGLDKSASPKQCASVQGRLLQQSQWMVHVWSVPGWESAQGLFGEVNPALACPDGTYFQRPPREWAAHPLNACKSAT